jgi:hypothetical protein
MNLVGVECQNHGDVRVAIHRVETQGNAFDRAHFHAPEIHRRAYGQPRNGVLEHYSRLARGGEQAHVTEGHDNEQRKHPAKNDEDAQRCLAVGAFRHCRSAFRFSGG